MKGTHNNKIYCIYFPECKDFMLCTIERIRSYEFIVGNRPESTEPCYNLLKKEKENEE